MVKNDIDRCSGAYRIERGKCNIDFSHEVFEFIKEKEEAVIIIGDFTKFFDNLDHKKLKNRIEKILSSKINDNLYKVFKSLTKFKYVNIEDLYEELEIEHLPETSYSSVGGMLYELSESVPELNQEFKVTAIDDILNEHNDYVQTITTLYYTITKMEDRRITEIKLIRK